jgi:hypothetical protein
MTKKDYTLIANAIAATVESIEVDDTGWGGNGPDRITGIKEAMVRLADDLAGENPRFRPALFIAACGFPLPLGRCVNEELRP